jgi:glycosyltransferase involved in cell wall biosynthesis
VPYFSLITPAYNREACIGRAVESCLAQAFADFELIVVDDASTDATVAVVESFRDSRIRLIRHATNRGPCPARNAAIRAAEGEWCVMVDSDFALRPNALQVLYDRSRNAPSDVGNLASSCMWDTGDVSPAPPRSMRLLDYCDYLTWMQELSISEKLECVRRSALSEIRYPDSRAWEFEFHLDLACRWRIELSEEILVDVFSDAPNRLTTASDTVAMQRVLADASDKLASFESILDKHGDGLRRCAPRLYNYTVTLTGHHAFLVGNRGRGLRYLAAALRSNPREVSTWAALVVGLLGRRAAAWATVKRRQTSRV